MKGRATIDFTVHRELTGHQAHRFARDREPDSTAILALVRADVNERIEDRIESRVRNAASRAGNAQFDAALLRNGR
ncbi:MAG TPA: hypothetical protein VGM82_02745 [Gemmatimonadaceae bacterium]